MNSGYRGPLAPWLLVAYLEGETTPSEADAIEASLAQWPAARRRLGDLEVLRDAFRAPVAELEGLDLVPRLRLDIRSRVADRRVTPLQSRAAQRHEDSSKLVSKSSAREHHPQPARSPQPFRSLPWWNVWQAGFVAAACALLAGSTALIEQRDPWIRAKSSVGTLHERERWAGIQAYRVGQDGTPHRLDGRLPAGDGLLFSYTNLGQEPFDYLMVFAIDARSEVRWFYPAYEQPGENPESILVQKGEVHVPLPHLIHHDFAPGPLRVYALFTTRPRRVMDVEALVRQTQSASAPHLSFPDSAQQVLETEVEP